MNTEKIFKAVPAVTFVANTAALCVLSETESLPEAGNSFGEWILALWIFLFGVAYLRLASSKTR